MKRKSVILVVASIMLLQLILPFSANANSKNEQIAKVNVDGLNVRSGPGLSYKVTSQIQKNEQYPVIDEENKWYKIQLSKSKTGWIASWLVTIIKSNNNPSGQIISSKVDGLNVRTGPGVTFPILGQVYPSENFSYITEKGDWTNIDYKGKSAWVASWLIKKEKTKDKAQNSNSTSNSNATVSATALNVRTGPSTTYSIIGTLTKGDKIVITDVKNGWYQINYKNQKAWVASDYIKKLAQENDHDSNQTQTKQEKAKVTATILNVRDKGSLNGKIIDQLKQNTSVEILKEEQDWAYISYHSSKGWVANWYLEKVTKSDTNNTSIDQGSTPKVTLLYDATNLRSGPSTNHSIYQRGNKGDQFPIISTEGDWYKILLPNKKEAYVAGWIVSVSNSLPPVKQENIANYIKGKTFVIDPGHGGQDGGAIGFDNRVLEKNVTLKTADLLASKLDSAGAKVIMTRQDDHYISLLYRVSVSHYYNADGFISIHYNSSIFPSARGITSFYYNAAQEKNLASTIQKELIKATGLKDRGVAFGDFQVLRTNRQPSVLLELGFLSNPEENYLIGTNSYQEKLAEAIYLGLGHYYDS